MLALLVAVCLAFSASAETLQKPKAEITYVPSQVVRLRPPKPSPQCVQALPEVFHPAGDDLGHLESTSFRLAGDGDTLGLIEQVGNGEYKLRLFQRKKQKQEFLIESTLPYFSNLFIADRGEYAVLAFRDAFAVYAGGSLVGEFSDETTRSATVAVVGGEVFWCPRILPRLSREDWQKGKIDKVPLCFHVPLSGGKSEDFFSLSAKRLHREFPNPNEWATLIVARPDRKLWLLGLASTEAVLLTSGGRVLRREWVPVSLYDRSQDMDPKVAAEYRAELEEESRELELASEEHLALPETSQATKAPTTKVPVRVFRFEPLIWRVAHRGRDLVFTGALPRGKSGIFLWKDGEDEVKCWVPPFPLPSHGLASMIAATDEELWFHEPLGYFRWSELEALWDDAFRASKETPNFPKQP